MKVPIAVYHQWKTLHSYGDVGEICEQTGYSRPVISVAISRGECTEDVMRKINEYYVHKAEAKREREKDIAEELLSQFQ